MDERLREKEISVRRRYSNHRLRHLLFDGEMMEQALINVLINSIDAVDRGGTIEIRTMILRGKGRSLIVEISDDGVGITPEDLPFVFDPFFSSKKKGTGLGLATVKKVIEAHGGRVDASAREPKGTHLRLIFPVKEGS